LSQQLCGGTAQGIQRQQAALTETEINERVAKLRAADQEVAASNYVKVAKNNDTRGHHVVDGEWALGDPAAQAISAGDLNVILGDQAYHSGETEFDVGDLDKDNEKRLSNVSGGISSSVARHGAGIVRDKHVENGGGNMSTDEFTTAFLDELREYRNNT